MVGMEVNVIGVRQVLKNAITAFSTLALVLLFAFGVSSLMHHPFMQSFKITSLIAFGGCILYLYISALHQWIIKGQLELDCGALSGRQRWPYFLVAIMFFSSIALQGCLDLSINTGLYLSVVIYYLYMAFAHLQICTQGIWLFDKLLRWQHILCYQWQDTTLILVMKSQRMIKLVIPANCQAQVETTLQEHLGDSQTHIWAF